ncbi:hypothetical protein BT67DRAFT_277464 [Trichocladium antarcticum]|uniref:Uncharacterized protein n=1 Tax=Trichocladium antarcticum TaxID=1450529 RepID=A0AAN6ZEZ8_9PEZI|nr:hypothetical protein BT67DRAFT_277464 [Trichocladium antarcticum]
MHMAGLGRNGDEGVGLGHDISMSSSPDVRQPTLDTLPRDEITGGGCRLWFDVSREWTLQPLGVAGIGNDTDK